jgi:hypothetical protein
MVGAAGFDAGAFDESIHHAEVATHGDGIEECAIVPARIICRARIGLAEPRGREARG